MAEILVPFTVGEDDVNTLDTIPVTVASFSGATIVRVPVRLEVWREAGDAYTIARHTASPIDGSTGAVFEPYYDRRLDENDNVIRVPYLIIRGLNSSSVPRRTVFRIPVDDLTGTVEKVRVITPVAELDLTAGDATYTLSSTAAISGGTGSIRGNLYFDERCV